MQIALAADHAGYDMKAALLPWLLTINYEVTDLGAYEPFAGDDYPDYAKAVAEEILGERADRGVLICGSGVGASVAANKIPGIRAGLCHDHYSAIQGVEHDNINVLVLGARVIGIETARYLIQAFMTANFCGKERYRRRLDKVFALELNPPRSDRAA